MIGTLSDVFETDISGLSSEGAGVGRHPDGRVAFVHRTAPGDRVRARVIDERARWVRGSLDEVLVEGPERRVAPCPLYDRCGGCVFQHLSTASQVSAKRRRVVESLRRIGGFEGIPEPSVHAGPKQTHYRSRVTFGLRRLRGARVLAGFHELEDRHRILDVDARCLLPELPVVRAWDRLRASWGPGAERLPDGAELRLGLRGLFGGEVVLLIEGGRGSGRPMEILAAAPEISAVWHRAAGEDEPRLLAGRANLSELWYGENVPVDPRCFLQPNREGGELLHDAVLTEVGPAEGRRVIDAYCGYGVYGRALAQRGADAVGIELDAGAVAVGRERPVSGFELIQGKVEERLGARLPADIVILNPPRVGVAQGVMERLDEWIVPRVIYVSCDPATLARDLQRLGPAYEMVGLHVFDLFPMTAHVETVAVLDRRGDRPGLSPDPPGTEEDR